MKIWTHLQKSRRADIVEGFRLCTSFHLFPVWTVVHGLVRDGGGVGHVGGLGDHVVGWTRLLHATPPLDRQQD